MNDPRRLLDEPHGIAQQLLSSASEDEPNAERAAAISASAAVASRGERCMRRLLCGTEWNVNPRGGGGPRGAEVV